MGARKLTVERVEKVIKVGLQPEPVAADEDWKPASVRRDKSTMDD